MTQTLGDLGFTLAEAGVDGAAAADFSEAFEADTEAPGVDSTPAEEEAGAIIIMAGVETTPETGGTRTTGEDFPTDFAGDVSTTLSSAINVNDVRCSKDPLKAVSGPATEPRKIISPLKVPKFMIKQAKE